MISAVIFDLDGTIADNTDQIFMSYKQAIHKMGLKYPGDIILRTYMGRSLNEIAKIINLDNNQKDLFLYHYKQSLSKMDEKFIEGMRDLLYELIERQIPIAIVTSKFQETTDALMNKLELNGLFKVIITANNSSRLKPDPEPILRVCQVLKIKADNNVIYVGDSINDMIAAQNAGIAGIGVTWGVHKHQVCDFGFDCVENTQELLNKLIKKDSKL